MEAGEKEVSRATAKLRGTSGALILTDRRLLFEHSSGLVSKKSFTALAIPLLAISDVRVERGFTKSKLVLTAQGQGYSGVPRIEIVVASPDRWSSMISSQASLRQTEIDEEKKKSRISYVVDFSFLKAEMERGGISLESIKCPSCGANVDMPEQGSFFKCSYCGSQIQSQDVFERMKGLLQSL